MPVTTWSLQMFRPAPQPPRPFPDGVRLVHTCSLDGPAALANYQARGLVAYAEDTTAQAVPAHSPGPWAATTGRFPIGTGL